MGLEWSDYHSVKWHAYRSERFSVWPRLKLNLFLSADHCSRNWRCYMSFNVAAPTPNIWSFQMGRQPFHLTRWQTTRKHLWSLFSQICHIIREIRQFQQAPYRIEHQPKVSVDNCPLTTGSMSVNNNLKKSCRSPRWLSSSWIRHWWWMKIPSMSSRWRSNPEYRLDNSAWSHTQTKHELISP